MRDRECTLVSTLISLGWQTVQERTGCQQISEGQKERCNEEKVRMNKEFSPKLRRAPTSPCTKEQVRTAPKLPGHPAS